MFSSCSFHTNYQKNRQHYPNPSFICSSVEWDCKPMANFKPKAAIYNLDESLANTHFSKSMNPTSAFQFNHR